MIPEICYWDHTEHKLVGNIGNKVRQFLREKKIQATSDPDIFLVHPCKGRYITHTVDMCKGTCTCQRNTSMHLECSHYQAVRLFRQQVLDGGRNLYEFIGGQKKNGIESTDG